jgi:hypothetical protein
MIWIVGLVVSSFKEEIVHSSLDHYRLVDLQHHLQRFLGLGHDFKGCLDFL